MSMSLRTVAAAVLLALALTAGAATLAAAADPRPPADQRQQTRGADDAAHTTTVIAQPAPSGDRSAPFTVLLVGVGAAVGVLVGVIPALLAATLLGYLPPPRLRRAGGLLVEPPRVERRAAPRPEPAPAPLPAPVALAAAEEPPQDPQRSGQLAILAHARHQGVYDAAYAEQLDRVETLRSAIGGRRGTSPEPPSD
jgi:hypothetical protein